jgi:hypothetical protein
MTRMVVDPAGRPDEEGFSCQHCGSPQIRRSSPKGLFEYLLRSSSPVHFYRCRACGRRGARWGRIPRAGEGGGRPLESRDVRLRRKRRVRVVFSAAIAVALGVASGLYLHSCEQAGEARARAPASNE